MSKPVFWAIVAGAYMLPAMIAMVRRHPCWRDIVALNFFLGWMVLGWIAAAIWSLSPRTPKPDLLDLSAPGKSEG